MIDDTHNVPTKVLLLDDEKLLLLMYKTKFEKSGYEVQDFTDADAALSALRRGYEPDVILFDITMPDSRSGYEFVEALHQEGLAKRALKIALTNEGQDAEIGRVMELGADDHWLKASFTPLQIVEKVTAARAKRV